MVEKEEWEARMHQAETNGRAEMILTRFGDSILRYAYTYLHNMSDAEEVLQDTLVQFLKTAPEFESENHEKAWLLRVAANLSKNRIRYNKLRETDELNEELVAEEREDLSFVWEAVKSLPVKYREVIHLFYHEGYQTAQIAKVLGRNESTVRSDLRRGREKLKEVLKGEYDFEEI
ncbi:sigma-70 family RNA polymerase sigma factor [Clostridium sp. MCC328]|nr:sigma-70 family RNA polymerase sigma factor [Clostridium sp. MCC328]